MITQIEGEILNHSLAGNQKVALGGALRSAVIQIDFTVAVDASSGLTIPVPYGIKIRDVIVQCTVASGSGTLTLRKSTTAITDAMACVTDKAIARAVSIDDEQSTIVKDSAELNVIANGGTDRGIVTIIGVPV